MTLADLKNEAIHWRWTKYRLINFAIGLSSLLLYEFVGRPYYRPYIYAHNIFDFHIADTIGNSLGTIAAVFIQLSILINGKTHANTLIKLITITLVIYELGQPLLGKPIDMWDIVATTLSGACCYFLFQWLYRKEK